MLVIVDFALGFTNDRLFTDLPDTSYLSLFKTCPDILILGPSTAKYNYVPQLFADSLKKETFNAGLDGKDVVYSDVVLNSILNRTDVDIVILDVGESQLNGKWINSSMSDIKMYYKRSQEVTKYYDNETNWQQRLKLKSNLYRYNQACYQFIRALLRPDTLNGFRPLIGQKTDFVRAESHFFSVDSTELKHLENIVEVCKNRGVKLLLVKSPVGYKNIAFNKWMIEFAESKGIPFYNEDANDFWDNHRDYFYDASHLNSEGADEFSRKIVSCVP